MRQTILVHSIPWSDPISGQQTVELETGSGSRFTCFMDGGVVSAGGSATFDDFDYLEAVWEVLPTDQVWSRSIAQAAEWDLEVVGPILVVDADAAWVDADGVLFAVFNFSRDQGARGTWLRVRYTRLEVGIAQR